MCIINYSVLFTVYAHTHTHTHTHTYIYIYCKQPYKYMVVTAVKALYKYYGSFFVAQFESSSLVFIFTAVSD
jgi:hypothetical protein